MAQGLGMNVNEEPRVKETDEKKLSGRTVRKNVDGRAMGSRRIFAPHFKLKVLDSYRQDSDCRGNQRATARKWSLHRRQIQKWIKIEADLRARVDECDQICAPNSVENGALNLCAVRQVPPSAAVTVTTPTDLSVASPDGSILPGEEMSVNEPRLSSLPSFPAEDSSQCNRKVTVSLFPSVKIEQLTIENELPVNLISNDLSKEESALISFPSIKIEDPVDLEVKDEPLSEDEVMVPLEADQALDFTCDALSKRRSFSLQFKLEVLNAFHSDRQCHGNQRATARMFGINRRQVQKWLIQEQYIRETVSNGLETVSNGLYRHRLGKWIEVNESKPTGESVETPSSADIMKESNNVCWDLSNRKRKSVPLNEIPFKKRTVELLKEQNKDNTLTENVTSSAEYAFLPEIQETALCLVKAKCQPNAVEERSSSRNSEVSSSADLNRVIGQALYHSNREHIIPPYIHFPIPTLAPSCFPPPEVGYHDLHHMLSFYRGFVGETKLRENLYPLDFKLKGLDYYRSNGFCRGNQYAFASRFGIDQDQIQPPT